MQYSITLCYRAVTLCPGKTPQAIDLETEIEKVSESGELLPERNQWRLLARRIFK